MLAAPASPVAAPLSPVSPNGAAPPRPAPPLPPPLGPPPVGPPPVAQQLAPGPATNAALPEAAALFASPPATGD